MGRRMERLASMLLGAEIKRSRAAGETEEEILAKLRHRGYSKLDSVAAFHDAGLPLMEAWCMKALRRAMPSTAMTISSMIWHERV